MSVGTVFLELRYRTEYWIMLLTVLFVRLLPWATSLKIGDWIGDVTFRVLHIRRRVALDNLRHVFPNKSEEELCQIAHRAYKNFTKMTIEYSRFPDLTPQKMLRLVEFADTSPLEQALRGGKGCVLIGGHFGNWELMGAALRVAGYPVTFLVGEQHNKFIDDMMNRNRQMFGIEIIHMGAAVRGVMKALRQNRVVALLSDQDAGRSGVFVDFLGRQASTPKGSAVFALKTGARVVFGSAVRLADDRHRIYLDSADYDGPLELTEDNIQRLTQAYTSILERYVVQFPDHWFWMHRRWKTQPNDR